jgi:DNA-binding response OmpR family regulator
MHRILIVEDNHDLAQGLANNLEIEGFSVDVVHDGAEGLERARAGAPALVILDLSLPSLDGYRVLSTLRAEGNDVPVLILTARTEEADKVRGFRYGADDYVTKPFGLAELRARIAALLRRTAGPAADASGTIRHGPLTMDLGRRVASVNGEPLDLTPREYELLRTMLSQPGRLLTKARLLRAVWGTAYADEGHYLHVYVSRLRRKLAAAAPDGSLRDLIVAEPGVGYRVGETSNQSGRPPD